jgi:hypothetical protein
VEIGQKRQYCLYLFIDSRCHPRKEENEKKKGKTSPKKKDINEEIGKRKKKREEGMQIDPARWWKLAKQAEARAEMKEEKARKRNRRKEGL